MLTSKQREMWRVNKYVWIMLGFLLVWLAGRFATFDPATQGRLSLVFLAGFLNVSLRTYVASRSPDGTSGRWGWTFTGLDIVLIAAAVRITGGLRSDLWLVYLPLVLIETLNVSAREQYLMVVLTLAGYAAAVWPFGDGLTVTVRLFFLYLVSAIAHRLAQNERERAAQIAHLRQELGLAEEKSRVARELHDGLGREIVNVILGLEVARRTAVRRADLVGPLLDENLALLRSAMDQTRTLIFETRPWTLEDEDCATLGERLEAYARQFASRTGLALDVRCELGDLTVGPQTAFGVLRIVQEALNNVAKHAHAGHVTLRLERQAALLVATVTDDGVGFVSPSPAAADRGIGLRAMQERAAGLGGRVTVESAPDRGTVVCVRVPS